MYFLHTKASTLKISINRLTSRELRLHCLMPIILFMLLGGCAGSPKLDPVSTTYPANKETQVTNIINLPIPISINIGANLTGGPDGNPTNEKIGYSPGVPVLRTDYTQTVMGDAAEKELWILPRNMVEISETKLMARLDEGGRRACGGTFLLKDTKYYYGTEGTLRLSGIKTPALKAVYRCQAKRVPVNDPDFSAVAKLASRFKDHKYFDISSFIIHRSPENVAAALQSIIQKRHLNTIKNTLSSPTRTIVASGSIRRRSGAVPENLVVIIRGTKDGAKVTLMQMRYQTTSHERGVDVAGTSRPGFSRDARPFARDVAYDYSRMFAGQILNLSGK